jgi:hypothetical protein
MESGRARRASEAPDARQLPLERTVWLAPERRVLLVEQQLLVES